MRGRCPAPYFATSSFWICEIEIVEMSPAISRCTIASAYPTRRGGPVTHPTLFASPPTQACAYGQGRRKLLITGGSPMPTPYNLDVHHSCETCPVRKERAFCNLSEKTVSSLNAMKFTSVYPKGSLLFVEGEKPRGVFVVCTGKVKLTTSSAEGKTLIVAVAQPGEILRASAAVTNTPYQISAETTHPPHVNFVKPQDFLLLMTQPPDSAMPIPPHLTAH